MEVGYGICYHRNVEDASVEKDDTPTPPKPSNVEQSPVPYEPDEADTHASLTLEELILVTDPSSSINRSSNAPRTEASI